MKKRALITGITGMAGSHLADFLLAQNDIEVFGTKRSRSPLKNIEHLQDRVQLIDCNLADAMSTLTAVRTAEPDYIFHLAALSYVPDSWDLPAVTLSNNVLMQLHVLEAVRHLKMDPVIQIALSAEEYGKVLDHELPIKEGNPFRPLSPYAVSKVAQDMLAYQYHQTYGLRTIRTRPFSHDGPRRGEVFATSNFAKQIAQIEAGLRPPVIHVGNLSSKRDWSDVRDVVRAYWLSVQHCLPGEDYLICSGQARSIQEMLDFLLSLSPVKIEKQVDASRLRPSDVPIMVGDPSKFQSQSGWKREYTFEQTMSDLLDYWRTEVNATSETSKKRDVSTR